MINQDTHTTDERLQLNKDNDNDPDNDDEDKTSEQNEEAHKLPYNLTNEAVYKLVNESVGSIALQCGYDLAEKASLEILTEVCCDYLRNMCVKFKSNLETEGCRDPNDDFVSPLERAFHQLNVPSAANLHQFICRMDAIERHMTKTTHHKG